jgi:hypothetical protein
MPASAPIPLPPEVEAAIEKALPKRSYNVETLPLGWTHEDVRGWNRCVEAARPAVRAACHLAIALFTTGAERAAHRAAAEELEK